MFIIVPFVCLAWCPYFLNSVPNRLDCALDNVECLPVQKMLSVFWYRSDSSRRFMSNIVWEYSTLFPCYPRDSTHTNTHTQLARFVCADDECDILSDLKSSLPDLFCINICALHTARVSGDLVGVRYSFYCPWFPHPRCHPPFHERRLGGRNLVHFLHGFYGSSMTRLWHE